MTAARAGRARRYRGTGLVLAALLLGGCPEEPEPPPDACAGGGEPTIALANRSGGDELADGDEVEVFPPPQGGVFTELDVTVQSLFPERLEYLWVRVVTPGGQELAVVRFFGDSIPLRCTQAGHYEIDNLPVGFSDALTLQDLDGVSATLTGLLETTEGDFETQYEVVLRATDY